MLKHFISDLKNNYKYAIYSARAQLKAEVAGSYLNWIWWILQPFCFMIIYAIVFGVIFSAREPYFTAFIFIGISIWDFFNRNIKQSVRIVKKNKDIITKVYMPKFIIVLANMFVNGFKMLISFAIVVFLMIVLRIPVSFNLVYVIPLMVDLLILNFGIMCILSHFGVYVEDLSNVVNIFLRFIFYISGVMFDIEHRLAGDYPVIAKILEDLNPIAYFMKSFRLCMIYSETPGIKMMVFWFAVSIVISMIGVAIIYKNENSYAKVI